MKIIKILFGLVIAYIAFSYISESLRTHSVVSVNETQLCIPKRYELMVNLPFLWFIDSDSLDEEAAGGLYLIPAEEIKKGVPDYTLSHINQYQVDLKHDITGIIWAKNQVGNPKGMANSAWNIMEEKEHAVSIYNESYDLYEIGDSRYLDLWWHLAKSPPKQAAEMSDDWHIGYCGGKKPHNFDCDRMLSHKDIYFDFNIKALDIKVLPEVEQFLISKFRSWEAECKK